MRECTYTQPDFFHHYRVCMCVCVLVIFFGGGSHTPPLQICPPAKGKINKLPGFVGRNFQGGGGGGGGGV